MLAIFVASSGYLLYQNVLPKKADTNQISPSTTPATNTSETYCSNAGEIPISNFDFRTGKINPDIKIKKCCPGLVSIQKKQPPTNKGRGTCGMIMGGPNAICSPCGNGVCDSQYEDYCNCPKDCK